MLLPLFALQGSQCLPTPQPSRCCSIVYSRVHMSLCCATIHLLDVVHHLLLPTARSVDTPSHPRNCHSTFDLWTPRDYIAHRALSLSHRIGCGRHLDFLSMLNVPNMSQNATVCVSTCARLWCRSFATPSPIPRSVLCCAHQCEF